MSQIDNAVGVGSFNELPEQAGARHASWTERSTANVARKLTWSKAALIRGRLAVGSSGGTSYLLFTLRVHSTLTQIRAAAKHPPIRAPPIDLLRDRSPATWSCSPDSLRASDHLAVQTGGAPAATLRRWHGRRSLVSSSSAKDVHSSISAHGSTSTSASGSPGRTIRRQAAHAAAVLPVSAFGPGHRPASGDKATSGDEE